MTRAMSAAAPRSCPPSPRVRGAPRPAAWRLAPRAPPGRSSPRRQQRFTLARATATLASPPPAPPGRDASPGWRVALTTMPASRPTLGVSAWPDFDYDASGATTLGVVGAPDPARPGAVHLVFDVRTFEGPPVCGRTTKVFGLPLPPGVRIDIHPLRLEGWLDPETGACALDFDAEFRGSIFGRDAIRLPPMRVNSPLTTGPAAGAHRAAEGRPFAHPRDDTDDDTSPSRDVGDVGSSPSSRDNKQPSPSPSSPLDPCLGGVPGDVAELVAIARVPRVEGPWDWLMNALLALPNDALAVLPCRLRVWDPSCPGGEDHRAMIGGEGSSDDAPSRPSCHYGVSSEEERRIVRALDDRFEYAARAGDPVPITESQLDLAFYTFG